MPARQHYILALGMALSVMSCQASQDRNDDHRALARWSIEQSPDFLSPGAVLGNDSVFFFRAVGGAFGEDGDIVVAVGGGENRVLYIDAEGRIRAAFGGRGSGPGEFGNITAIYHLRDRIGVWDVANRRVTMFARRRRLSEWSLQIPPVHRPVGLFPDNVFVTTPASGDFAELRFGEAAVAEGEVRSYHLWGADGVGTGVLTGVPDPPPSELVLRVPRENGRETLHAYSLGSSCLPETRHLTTDQGLLIADSHQGRLFWITRSGTSRLLFESKTRGVVAEAAVAAVRQWIENTSRRVGTPTTESIDAVLNQLGMAGQPLPSVWSAMRLDGADRIWLQRASCFSEDPEETWDVVDKQGNAVATVVIPRAIRVWSIGTDRLLGVVTDGLGVEQVAIFRFGVASESEEAARRGVR